MKLWTDIAAFISEIKPFLSTAFTAGVAGAIVSLAFDIKDGRAKVGLVDVVIVVVSGGLTAQHAEEVVIMYIPGWATFISFLIGMTAIFVVGGIISMAKSFARDPLGFIGRFGDALKRLRGK